MSVISAICAEHHNEMNDVFKRRFKNCKDFEEFQMVLKDFEEMEFQE